MAEDSKDKNAAKAAAVHGQRVEHRRSVGAGANDAGGLTEAPRDESPRTAARQVTKAGTRGAPIEAPDAGTQLEPEEGKEFASTNPVADFAGLRNFAGENHVRFVDEDGEEVAPASVFEDPGADVTYVTAKRTVYEEFRYPGVFDSTTRQYVLAGRRYPKDKAAKFAAATARADAQAGQNPPPAA